MIGCRDWCLDPSSSAAHLAGGNKPDESGRTLDRLGFATYQFLWFPMPLRHNMCGSVRSRWHTSTSMPTERFHGEGGRRGRGDWVEVMNCLNGTTTS